MFADWLAHQQRLRGRKLHVVRLEDRRLPDASFALIAGVLTLDGFDAGDQLSMDFDGTTDEFHFDLQSGKWDAADVAGGPFTLSNGDQTLSVGVSSLDAIYIDASAGPLAAITDGPNGLATNTLQILGGGAVTLDSAANDFDTVSVQADSLVLYDGNALQLDDIDISGTATIIAVGSLDDAIGSAITVGGHADLSAGSIVLGEGAGDVVNFGTLTVNASGDVTITEDSRTDLTGSNTADLLTVTSSSHVDVAGVLTAIEVHVESGGILSGNGFVDASVTTDSGAHIESPISPDVLATQDFSLTGGASLDAVLGGSDVTPLNSRLNVTGTVTLAGNPALSIDPLLTPVDGTEFELITNDGMESVNGTFAGLNEGDTLTVGGHTFVISYSGGDGNDVSLFAGVPVYDFASAAFSVTETNTGILVSNAVLLNRSGNTAVASSVDITIAAGSGMLGAESTDFVAETVTITFAAGATSATVPVRIVGDRIVESTETLSLRMSGFTSGGVAGTAQPTTTVEIGNDDSATLSIQSVTLDESDGVTTNFVFQVELSAAVQDGLTALFATADGTATSLAGAFQDFSSQSEFLTFVGTALEQQFITVAVNADTWFEATEDFQVSLGTITANDAAIDESLFLSTSGTPATGILTNDDTPILIRTVGGGVAITDEVQGGADSRLTILHDSSTNEVVIRSVAADLGTGSAATSNEVRIAAGLITGQITELGRAGNNVLTVDFSSGTPIVGTGLTFSGGPAATGDGLAVVGDGTNIAEYSPDAATTGSGRITVDGRTIDFSGVESLDLSGLASVAVLTQNADDALTVANGTDFLAGGTQDALRISGTSGGAVITSAALWNNSAVTIDTTASDGDDRVTIARADNGHANSSLSVLTGSGADVIAVNGPIDLMDDLVLSAAQIRINTPTITTGESQDYNGSTQLQQFATLTSAATGAAVTMNAVDGGGHDLMLNSGSSGDISMASVTNAAELQILNSGSTTIAGMTSATAIVIDDTSSEVTFGGAVTATSITTAAQSYSVDFRNGGTITNATTFQNTGGVIFGDENADVITFTNGVTSVASVTTVQGTVQTSGADIVFGSTTLLGAVGLNTGPAAGDITIRAIAGAGVTLDVNAGTGNIDLSNPANVIGDLDVVGNEVAITESDDITQGAAWTTTGNTTLDAQTSDVLLINPANRFGTLNAAGDVVRIVENADTELGSVTATSVVELTSASSILDANGVANNISAPTAAVSLSAVQDIGIAGAEILTSTASDPLEITAAILELNAGDDIAVHLQQTTVLQTLNGDLAFLSGTSGIDLSTAAPFVRGLSVLAPTGTITLPAVTAVPGDLRIEGVSIEAAGGTISLQAQRTLFSSRLSESVVLNALTRDAAGLPGAAGNDPGQFDGSSNGSLTVTSTAAVLQLADLDGDLSSIDVGRNEFALDAVGIVRQLLPFSGIQNSRVLAGNLQLTGTAAFELNNTTNDIDVGAGVISGPLTFADIDDLTIGTTSTATGLTSGNRDVLLQIGSLHLQQSLDAGTADVRLRSRGNVTQSATAGIIADELAVLQDIATTGDIDLIGLNDVNVTALSNQYNAGDIALNDVDDLIIDQVRGASSAGLSVPTLAGVTAVGGDITVTSRGDLTILRSVTSRDGIVDNTAATGEHIILQSVDGNILVDATDRAIVISTDENAVTSNSATGDSVSLLADSDATYDGDLDGDAILDQSDPDVDGDAILNNADSTVDGISEGQVTLLSDVTLSTDGGVAKRFGPRPVVGEPSTAFFVYPTSPLPRVFDNNPAAWASGNAYINAFDVAVGVTGEQNLQVDVDWLDPINEFLVVGDAPTQAIAAQLGLDNPMSSERIQQFLVADGGSVNTIGHLYTARDFTRFQVVQHLTTIPVDLSVAHHSSIGVRGTFIDQNAANQPVPGGDAASTDNVLTGGATFENGLAQFRIPTVTPVPPGLFVPAVQPRVDRPTSVAPPENRAALDQSAITDFSGAAVGGSAFSTEVYFQIRRQFELAEPSEVVIERVTDGRLISSRDALEEFVRENPELQDGSGYEIWLVTETGGQKVERPIVEFEITGGKPGPAAEEMPETAEPPRLKDVPFEQPEE